MGGSAKRKGGREVKVKDDNQDKTENGYQKNSRERARQTM